MKSGGYVYILTNKKNRTLYIGSTTDLIQRVWQHKNKKFPGFTARYNVDKLMYYEWHDSLFYMVARERAIKEWKRYWKIKLIEEKNPEWNDLYNDVLSLNGFETI
ncbi:MAG: GIY-YIG nuclease family protein [Rickettsiales bacterium]|jgi:putative endonuclease|nr:GIY-YIG nuclease family protein [Rickettsiales bacterium]